MRASGPHISLLTLIILSGTLSGAMQGLFYIDLNTKVTAVATFVFRSLHCLVGLAVVDYVANAGSTWRRTNIRYHQPAQVSLLFSFGLELVFDAAKVRSGSRRQHIRFHEPAHVLLLSSYQEAF